MRTNRAVIFLILLAYPPVTYWLMKSYGPSAGMLGIIPVGMTGTLYGPMVGTASGGGFILLNALIFVLAGGVAGNGLAAITGGNFLLESAVLLLTGVLSGWSKYRTEYRALRDAEISSREKYLSLMNKMAHAIITAEDLDVMMRNLTRDLKSLLGADDCYITHWNEQLKKTIPVNTSLENIAYEKMDFHPDQLTMTRSVLDAGRPLAAEDVNHSPYISPEIASKFPARSILGLPLIHGEIRLGAILIAFNTPHSFSTEEISRAEQVANQLAIAIWNARQDLEVEKRLKESNTLNQISRALSQSERIGLSNLLNLIAASARDLISGAEQAIIHLLNEDGQSLSPEAVAGLKDPGERRTKMRLGEGVAGQVIATGETMNIADVNTDDRFIKIGATPRFTSLMVAPIISGSQKLGTISVHSKYAFAFTDNDKDLLTTLGAQAAIALENTRLLESTTQSLRETNALYQVSKSLVSLDAGELLKDVVDLLQRNFGYYHVQVFIVDPTTGHLVLEAGSGSVGQKLKSEGFKLQVGAGIVGYAAETSAPFFTNNVDEIVFFIRNPYLPETKSELAVPVKSGMKTLGILDIQQAPPNQFSPRDIQLVSAVADQLAVALQKAELYQNLQISLEQEKLIRSQLIQSERLAMMGKLLASVSHELNNPLQAIQNALFLLKVEQGLSSQGRQDLEIVLSETERMATMIERLRATYRPIQVEDFRPMQINTIVEDVYALVSTHFRHRDISFEFFPDPQLPIIPGLPDQIRQVILNLFMNAADAIHTNGQLSVSTKLLENEKEVFLSVSDTGTGIDPQILPNVFEAFITNKMQGTGLGLTICYDIVIKHKGRITAENNPDRGATFKIWLPTRRAESQ